MAGLVLSRREGKRHFYRLSDSVAAPAPGVLSVATAVGTFTLAMRHPAVRANGSEHQRAA